MDFPDCSKKFFGKIVYIRIQERSNDVHPGVVRIFNDTFMLHTAYRFSGKARVGNGLSLIPNTPSFNGQAC